MFRDVLIPGLLLLATSGCLPEAVPHGGVDATGACGDCHEARYLATTAPRHAAYDIGTDCGRCHGETSWSPVASFPHPGPDLPHAREPGCVTCHRDDDRNAAACTDAACHGRPVLAAPHEAAVGSAWSPLDCGVCHPRGRPFLVEHAPWFPVGPGTHHDVPCRECHPVDGQYGTFRCSTADCHGPSIDGMHRGLPGYSRADAACLDCHRGGHGMAGMP